MVSRDFCRLHHVILHDIDSTGKHFKRPTCYECLWRFRCLTGWVRDEDRKVETAPEMPAGWYPPGECPDGLPLTKLP